MFSGYFLKKVFFLLYHTSGPKTIPAVVSGGKNGNITKSFFAFPGISFKFFIYNGGIS